MSLIIKLNNDLRIKKLRFDFEEKGIENFDNYLESEILKYSNSELPDSTIGEFIIFQLQSILDNYVQTEPKTKTGKTLRLIAKIVNPFLGLLKFIKLK